MQGDVFSYPGPSDNRTQARGKRYCEGVNSWLRNKQTDKHPNRLKTILPPDHLEGQRGLGGGSKLEASDKGGGVTTQNVKFLVYEFFTFHNFSLFLIFHY